MTAAHNIHPHCPEEEFISSRYPVVPWDPYPGPEPSQPCLILLHGKLKWGALPVHQRTFQPVQNLLIRLPDGLFQCNSFTLHTRPDIEKPFMHSLTDTGECLSLRVTVRLRNSKL